MQLIGSVRPKQPVRTRQHCRHSRSTALRCVCLKEALTLSETKLARPQRSEFISANALWVTLFTGGIVLAVMSLNYLNKVFLVTYEVQGRAEFTFSSDQEIKQFQERLALKAKQENARFIFKATDGYMGSSLASGNPFKYQFQNFGYCTFRTCISASNDLEPNEFRLVYYDNSLISGNDNGEFRRLIEDIKQELKTRRLTGSTPSRL